MARGNLKVTLHRVSRSSRETLKAIFLTIQYVHPDVHESLRVGALIALRPSDNDDGRAKQ